MYFLYLCYKHFFECTTNVCHSKPKNQEMLWFKSFKGSHYLIKLLLGFLVSHHSNTVMGRFNDFSGPLASGSNQECNKAGSVLMYGHACWPYSCQVTRRMWIHLIIEWRRRSALYNKYFCGSCFWPLIHQFPFSAH